MKCYRNSILIFCLILGILGFAKTSYSKNVDIKVLMLRQSPIFWPFYIGIEKNYFAEEGVSITPIQLYRNAEISSAIRNGGVNLAVLPSTSVLVENEKAFFLTALSSVMNGNDSSVWAWKAISKLEDFRGKRMAIGNREAVDNLFMYGALKSKGIKPEAMSLVTDTGYYDRFMLARTGGAELILLPRIKYQQAKKEGMKNIFESKTFLPNFPSFVLIGNKNWILQNEDLTIRFLMGQIKAQWFINHNLDDSVELLANKLKKMDKELIQDVMYYRVGNGLIPLTAMINVRTYEEGIKLFKEFGLKIKSYGEKIPDLIEKTVNLLLLNKAKSKLCEKCWPLPSCPPK